MVGVVDDLGLAANQHADRRHQCNARTDDQRNQEPQGGKRLSPMISVHGRFEYTQNVCDMIEKALIKTKR